MPPRELRRAKPSSDAVPVTTGNCRIAVLASGEGTNLQALIDEFAADDGFEVVAVAVSRPEAKALARAQAAGIESAVFARADHPSREERDRELAGWLSGRDVAIVVLAGWMELLTPGLLEAFPGRVVNVHPSLLPDHPGLDAVGQALAAGASRTGVTVHLVDEGVDSGPILLQEAVDLPEGCSREQAVGLLRPLEHRLLPEAVRELAAGRLP